MSNDSEMFALELTPEMTVRLSNVAADIMKLLKERTARPEEAFIVLDTVTRNLSVEHGMFILSPITHSNTGHT